jgi:hypothetical protein
MGAPHVGDVLGGQTDHDISGADVSVIELVAAMHGPLRPELGNRIARAPAHRHAFHDVCPRRRDPQSGHSVLQERARHHRTGRVTSAEKDDVEGRCDP